MTIEMWLTVWAVTGIITWVILAILWFLYRERDDEKNQNK